jgi:murein DD-endopeptidase MepM/ murein hydrolase activator NlpD
MRAAALVLLAAVSAVALAQNAPDATWPMSDGHVVAGFGKHRGIDIAADVGTPVQAFRAGVVVTVDTVKGCGPRLRLRHGDVTSIYCNLADVRVTVGQQVSAGAELAKIAAPAPGGRAHLHFELQRAGEHVDPLTLLP